MSLGRLRLPGYWKIANLRPLKPPNSALTRLSWQSRAQKLGWPLARLYSSALLCGLILMARKNKVISLSAVFRFNLTAVSCKDLVCFYLLWGSIFTRLTFLIVFFFFFIFLDELQTRQEIPGSPAIKPKYALIHAISCHFHRLSPPFMLSGAVTRCLSWEKV